MKHGRLKHWSVLLTESNHKDINIMNIFDNYSKITKSFNVNYFQKIFRIFRDF